MLTFYKEERLKETPIGKIPEDWKVVKLGDIGKIVNGFGFPIKYQGKKDGKYIFVKVNDTNLPGNEKFIFTTENTIDDNLVKKLRVKIYPPGTIVFPKIGMVIYLRKVRILARAGTFDNNIMGIIPDRDVIDGEFLYYYFLGRIDLTKLAGRTTAPSIRKSEVEKLSISLPSLEEQKAIAHILSTVDEAIQKTNEIIAKTKRLKKGLMQELLTRGFTVGFMFDTNIFDEILDGKVELPENLRYYVTHLQRDEILDMPEHERERKEKLLKIFNVVQEEIIPTEGFVVGVSRLNLAKLMSREDSELYNKMFERLTKLDKEAGKLKSPENRAKDILIALTCLKNCLTLVTNDNNLKKAAQEFQCPVITFKQLLNGEYREFKDTEIGKIPKEWKVVKLGDALELCQYGLSIPLKERGKYPIVRMDEIVNGYVVPTITKYVDLDEKTFKVFKLEKGDILFNRTNAPDLVGRTGIFLLEGDYVFASYLIRLRVKREWFDPHFLTFYLIFIHSKLKQLATRAVHQANINATNLKRIKVPKPKLQEQKKIAEIFLTVDKRLEVERKRKEKLERIKKGLMDLLLTGRVRVKVG